MRPRVLPLFLLLLLFLLPLSACQKPDEAAEQSSITVYYVSTGPYAEGSDFVVPLTIPAEGGDDPINLALVHLGEDPEGEELTTALIKGTRIDSYVLEGSHIQVDLSAAYIGLSELEQTAVKACLTLTLCGLDEISAVSILVDGSPVAERLSPEELMVENTDSSEFEKRLLLYFPDSNGNYLLPEYRVLTVGTDKNLAEYVVEELLDNASGSGQSAIPPGTKLLSLELKNGVCTLNLSSEFIEDRSAGSAGQRLAVYSLVNSLTSLEGIEKVRFQVEGSDTRGYEYIDLSVSFTAFEDIVYDAQTLYQTGAILYLGLRGSDQIVAVPVFAPLDTFVSREESVVEYVLMHPGVSGYTRLVPLAVTINSVETFNRVCTVDLSDSFFSNGTGSNARRAALAIASSILDTGNADTVNVLVGGEPFVEGISQRIENLAP